MRTLKRTTVLAFLCFTTSVILANDTTHVADTANMRVNELHLNLLPFIVHRTFNTATDNTLQVQYKRGAGKIAFRATATYVNSFRSGPDHSVNPLNLIKTQPDGSIILPSYTMNGNLVSLAIGPEFRKTKENLTAHLGLDVYYGYQEYQNYVVVRHHKKDSLGNYQMLHNNRGTFSHASRRYYGGVVEAGLKYNLGKRWLLAASIQMKAQLVSGGYPYFSSQTWKFQTVKSSSIDFEMLGLSMFNIGYRF